MAATIPVTAALPQTHCCIGQLVARAVVASFEMI